MFSDKRYSFPLAADQPISNYCFRADPNVDSDGDLNSAILGYISCTHHWSYYTVGNVN